MSMAKLWQNLLPQKDNINKPAGYRRDYLLKALETIKDLHPYIYSGRRNASLSTEDVEQLVKELQRNKPAHIFKHQISFLCRGLEIGREEHNWDVYIPDPPVIVPREKPRFTHEDIAKLSLFYEIEEAFIADLPQGNNDRSYTLRVGRLLLCAVLYGGLIQKKWLIPWVEALSNPQVLQRTLWLNMKYNWRHKDRESKLTDKQKKDMLSNEDLLTIRNNAQFKANEISQTNDCQIERRWYADPLSEILIQKWYTQFPDDRKKTRKASPQRALKDYLKKILPNKGNNAALIQELFLASASRMSLGVTPFGVSYAEGKVKSASLPARVWHRLVSGCQVNPVGYTPPPIKPLSVHEQLKLKHPAQIAAPRDQEKFLREILNAVLQKPESRNKDQKDEKLSPKGAHDQLKNYYENHIDQICPVLACLIWWGLDLLNKQDLPDRLRGRTKEVLQPSSVKTYFATIGRKLLIVAGDEDSFMMLEGDELHEIYSEVIFLCKTNKSLCETSKRLRAFHIYLKERHGANPVDFSDISFSSDPAEANVDANLITPAEFDAVKKVLMPKRKKATRDQKMWLLVAILGFRCGLRRSEILKLLLIDILGKTEPEVLVRNNRYAYVKSTDAIRRIPLLLDADELDLLFEWIQIRHREKGKGDKHTLLFCHVAQPTTRLSERELFDPIQKALRQVTGDETLRFHHFRHSFATWMILRLLINIKKSLRGKFAFLNHPLFKRKSCELLRKRVLGSHGMGRQVLFSVAQLCGHSSPSVTMLHYFHLNDWLLSLELKHIDNQPYLTVPLVEKLSGLDFCSLRQKSFSRKLDLSKTAELIVPQRQFLPCFYTHPLNTTPLPNKEHHPSEVSELWRQVEAIVREWQLSEFTYTALAKRSDFSEQKIRDWCETAAAIMGMETQRGGSRHLNPPRKNRTNLSFPTALREVSDQKLAATILEAHDNLPPKELALLKWGLLYFLNRYTATRTGVPLSHLSTAKKYFRFLRLLGFPNEQIRLVETVSASTPKSAPSKALILAKKVGVEADQILTIEAHRSEQSRIGELRVKIIKSDNQDYESYGFRFALYMISIMELAANSIGRNHDT